MFGLLAFFSKSPKAGTVENIVKRIKAGDNNLKEKLVQDYKPFIAKTVSKVTNNFVDMNDSDEFSVALMAFNEAIECYDDRKSSSFLAFCSMVIQRRVIDFINANRKHANVYPFTYFENENSTGFEEKYLSISMDEQYESIEIIDQILNFEQKLLEFGITMDDLVLGTPKHKDSKQIAVNIGKTIATHDYLFEQLEKKKSVPMTDLLKHVNVNARTIERNRKYIIAVALILRSDLDVLKGYFEEHRERRAN